MSAVQCSELLYVIPEARLGSRFFSKIRSAGSEAVWEKSVFTLVVVELGKAGHETGIHHGGMPVRYRPHTHAHKYVYGQIYHRWFMFMCGRRNPETQRKPLCYEAACVLCNV